jgi:hypothetical protein
VDQGQGQVDVGERGAGITATSGGSSAIWCHGVVASRRPCAVRTPGPSPAVEHPVNCENGHAQEFNQAPIGFLSR